MKASSGIKKPCVVDWDYIEKPTHHGFRRFTAAYVPEEEILEQWVYKVCSTWTVARREANHYQTIHENNRSLP